MSNKKFEWSLLAICILGIAAILLGILAALFGKPKSATPFPIVEMRPISAVQAPVQDAIAKSAAKPIKRRIDICEQYPECVKWSQQFPVTIADAYCSNGACLEINR